ncbi:hypothetical protein J2Z34_000266 [Youngiibacter multivorans]|uniref:Uncharacterized protein n=2 Tax=Youngiibacter multivorans TaxID=937251 RepID=A0ABS4FZS8_9CLOT|nr:hypothetical protein [Youngiibacter multivorans]
MERLELLQVHNMIREIRGMLTFGPSPCLETPCMPGTAFQINEGNSVWYLKWNGRLLDCGDEFDGTRLQEGMHLRVSGVETILKDIYGLEHKVVELGSLEKL